MYKPTQSIQDEVKSFFWVCLPRLGNEPRIFFVFCLFSQTLILGNGGSLSIMCFLFSVRPCWGVNLGYFLSFFIFSDFFSAMVALLVVHILLFLNVHAECGDGGSFLSFADFTIFLCWATATYPPTLYFFILLSQAGDNPRIFFVSCLFSLVLILSVLVLHREY